MSTLNKSRFLGYGAPVVVLLLTLGVVLTLGSHVYAQAQAQPYSQTKSATTSDSETPAPVTAELQAIKAEIAQLQSKLNDLEAATPFMTAAIRPEPSSSTKVTLAGRVSCAHCEGIQPLHKGYTPFSWALYSVSQGDDVVLVTQDKTYKLQGKRGQLLNLMCDKVRVSGHFEGSMLAAESISKATKNE